MRETGQMKKTFYALIPVYPELISCRECGAWADNARPSEELRKQWGKE